MLLAIFFTGDIHLTNLHSKALEPLQPSFRSKKFLYFRGLATYFYIKFAKYIEREHYREYDSESECEGESIDDYWRDLFGPYYAFKKKEITLQENYPIVFRNVVLTEWIPLPSGLFYSDSMWKDHPENIRNLFGDVRFKEHYKKGYYQYIPLKTLWHILI